MTSRSAGRWRPAGCSCSPASMWVRFARRASPPTSRARSAAGTRSAATAATRTSTPSRSRLGAELLERPLAAADERLAVREQEVVEVPIEQARVGASQLALHPLGVLAEQGVRDELELPA